jgi:hypothetical protein
LECPLTTRSLYIRRSFSRPDRRLLSLASPLVRVWSAGSAECGRLLKTNRAAAGAVRN